MTDGICSKRLAQFLPEPLDRLHRRQALRGFPVAVQARVARMSAAAVDRAPKPLREQTKPRSGISTTKAGTLLKRQIAIRTFADWTDAWPGFFEIDLVADCGWSGAGQFLYTLSMVDLATGCVACAGPRRGAHPPAIFEIPRPTDLHIRPLARRPAGGMAPPARGHALARRAVRSRRRRPPRHTCSTGRAWSRHQQSS